jgi:GNAT superfamily N-acetyltransferase
MAIAVTANGRRMSGSLTIQAVNDRKGLAQFLSLPFELYKNDPLWVAPLRREARRTSDPRRNPFFKYADIQHFLAVDGRGAAVGRVAACVYPACNERLQTKMGFFGLLESIRDARVVKSLLNETEQWLASRGMKIVAGPYNYAPTQEMGLLVDGFDKAPALLETYNPPFYRDFIIAAGYQQSRSAGTYRGHDFEFEQRVPRLMAEADRICARCDLTIRPVDRSNVREELARMIGIYNEAFATDREIVPISEEVFRFQTSALLSIIDPHIFLFVERCGEAVGIGLALPNVNEVLARRRGELGLGTILRWKKTMRSIETAVALFIGVRPKAHGLGISRVLLAHLLQGALRSGYKGFHTGFVDEQNRVMRAGLKRIGYPRPHKQFAIFKKEL